MNISYCLLLKRSYIFITTSKLLDLLLDLGFKCVSKEAPTLLWPNLKKIRGTNKFLLF